MNTRVAMLEALDDLQQAVNSLRRGESPPPFICLWLAAGFARFIDEGGDLGEHLGFRTRRGGRFEAVQSLNKMRRRDELLCVLVIEQPPGSIYKRAERADAYLQDEGPPPVPGFSETVKRMLLELGLPLPSARRIRQIVGNHIAISRHGLPE